MEVSEKLVNIFKAFGDETRLKIIKLIFDESLSVSSIANEIKMSQSAVSHQLHILKLNGIVKKERKGKEIYYGLDDEHIKVIITTVYDHVSHTNHE